MPFALDFQRRNQTHQIRRDAGRRELILAGEPALAGESVPVGESVPAGELFAEELVLAGVWVP